MDDFRTPEVESLKTLCDKNGGFRAVATAIAVNDQSLYQILMGVKLKSGRPKGIGPSLRDKLNQRYPGWNVAASGTKSPATEAKFSEMALSAARLVDQIPASDDTMRVQMLAALVRMTQEWRATQKLQSPYPADHKKPSKSLQPAPAHPQTDKQT